MIFFVNIVVVFFVLNFIILFDPLFERLIDIRVAGSGENEARHARIIKAIQGKKG